MTTEPTRYPLTLCWNCQSKLDSASDADGTDTVPTPGSISLCFYCGAIAMFGKDSFIYPPTEEMLDKLQQDREFMKTFMSFQWYRQYVMVKTRD